MAQAALQTAVQKRGVAVLGFPGDVAGLPSVHIDSSERTHFSKATICPELSELQQLAGLIEKHNKICIFCGIGAADAHDEVIQLAALLKSPVGFSFWCKISIEYDNPYEVGMTGLLGLPAAYHSMHESDLVLLLGTDFPYTPFYPQGKNIVQIVIISDNIDWWAILTL